MDTEAVTTKPVSFYDRPGVEKSVISIANGVPFGMERVTNPSVGIGGVYGTWGDTYDNETLSAFLEKRLGFDAIPRIVGRTMAAHTVETHPTLETIIAADRWARQEATAWIASS